MPMIDVAGRPLHYLDEGKGPALLLIHGFPFSSELWRPQLEALSGSWRVIAPDLRGFGKSAPAGTTTMDDFAQDLVALLDALKIETAVVGGLSMGGYVAMALLRVDAGRVAALLLLDTQATADDEAGKQKREETARKVEAEGVGVLVDLQLAKLVSKSAPAEVRAYVERMMRSASVEGAAGALRGMGLRPDSKDVLARFSGPALVIVGTEDEVTPVAKSKQMADVLGRARLETIPGVGHVSNLEAPEAVNATLSSFLQSLQP